MFSTGESSAERKEQRDFILRLLRQIIRAVAQMAATGSGHRQAESLKEVHEAFRALLDIDPAVIHWLGAVPLSQLSADRGQLEPVALLLWAEASLVIQGGQEAYGLALREKALRLLMAARDRGVALGDESWALLKARG